MDTDSVIRQTIAEYVKIRTEVSREYSRLNLAALVERLHRIGVDNVPAGIRAETMRRARNAVLGGLVRE